MTSLRKPNVFCYEFEVEEKQGEYHVVGAVYSATSLAGTLTVDVFDNEEAAREMVRKIKAGEVDIASL